MDRTVREHIESIEVKRNLISGQIMEEGDTAKRNQLEAELGAVESALTLYRCALEIESRIS